MTDTQKPPMVVYISQNQLQPSMSRDGGEERGHFHTKKSSPVMRGPYVNLDQFVEAVESVADGKHTTILGNSYSSDYHEALKELVKEIKEGNK